MFSRFIQTTLGYEPAPEPSTTTSQSQELLPSELVGRILQLEMECEEVNASSKLVAELVSLYAQAYEYYERNNSLKCNIYQKRMHHFLGKHSIESLLKGQKSHLIMKREMVERKKQHAIYSSREAAQRIINCSEKRDESNRNTITKQITSQQKLLEERIQRRKSMSNRSTKTDNNEDQCEDLFAKKGASPFCNLVFEGMKERTGKRVFI